MDDVCATTHYILCELFTRFTHLYATELFLPRKEQQVGTNGFQCCKCRLQGLQVRTPLSPQRIFHNVIEGNRVKALSRVWLIRAQQCCRCRDQRLLGGSSTSSLLQTILQRRHIPSVQVFSQLGIHWWERAVQSATSYLSPQFRSFFKVRPLPCQDLFLPLDAKRPRRTVKSAGTNRQSAIVPCGSTHYVRYTGFNLAVCLVRDSFPQWWTASLDVSLVNTAQKRDEVFSLPGFCGSGGLKVRVCGGRGASHTPC